MSDIEIVFPQGREAVVRRLRDALADAGYDVGTREVGEGDRAPAPGGAGAVLILWDRSTMAHPGLEAAASSARSRGRAIDVSVDGITPLAMTDDRALIHLSGWRGDPHHPGWRKILARLDQLGPARREPTAARSSAKADTPARTTARPAAEGQAPPRRTGRVLAAAMIVALLLIVAVAALVMSRRAPLASPAPPAPAPAEPPPVAAAPSSAIAPAPAPGQETSPAPAAPMPVQPGAQPTTEPAAAVPPAGESVPAPHKAHVAKGGHEAGRPTIRYTRYSTTMRLFCARAGRGTPQCRVFNEAMRKQAGSR